jgi:hypothetical protein
MANYLNAEISENYDFILSSIEFLGNFPYIQNMKAN